MRYVGEPVAVVLARDRCTGADALERIAVSYRPLLAVIDPISAAGTATPLLHPVLGCNIISDRSFRYGDPETAFAGELPGRTVRGSVQRNGARFQGVRQDPDSAARRDRR